MGVRSIHSGAMSIFGGPRLLRKLLFVCFGYALFLFFFGSRLSATDALSRVLAHEKRNAESLFPKKIWQTWTVDPLSFDERETVRGRTWTQQNHGHFYEVLTDRNALSYVETQFGPLGLNRPDIVYTFKHLDVPIIKADLLRYLVMYLEGGIYSDIDVEALKPIDEFIPTDVNETKIDLIIGLEVDEPSFANHTILGPKCRAFCQWTFMAKPRLSVMLKIINHVVKWVNEKARHQDVKLEQVKLDFDDIMKISGPSAFTTVILEEMAAQVKETVHWEFFHQMTEARIVGRILVLPIDAFAAGQDHSHSGTHDSPIALVRHHYHATGWTDQFTRYSHPAYGMVEECSWKPDCVNEWDRNTTTFPTLPEDRQQELIADHERVIHERWEAEERQRQEERERREREDRERQEREERERKENEEREERERKEREDRERQGGGVQNNAKPTAPPS